MDSKKIERIFACRKQVVLTFQPPNLSRQQPIYYKIWKFFPAKTLNKRIRVDTRTVVEIFERHVCVCVYVLCGPRAKAKCFVINYRCSFDRVVNT